MPTDPNHGSIPTRAIGKAKFFRARSFSKPTMEILSEEPRCSTTEKTNFVGVKNHLPLFYEKNNYKDSEELEKELGAPTSSRRSKRWNGLCQFCLIVGIITTIFGIALILFGYLLPRKTVVVEKEASIEVHDKTAIEFNNLLEISIIFGVGFGCLGGTLAAISLTIISLLPTDDPTYEDSEKTALFAEYISQEQLDYDGPRSPIDEKIPAVEELKTVQPDWEKEEVKPKNGVVFRF